MQVSCLASHLGIPRDSLYVTAFAQIEGSDVCQHARVYADKAADTRVLAKCSCTLTRWHWEVWNKGSTRRHSAASQQLLSAWAQLRTSGAAARSAGPRPEGCPGR